MKGLGTCLMVLLLLCSAAYGQELWTLDACLDSALKNNSGIRQIAVNTDIAKLRHTQSMYNFTPNIGGYMGQSYNYGRNLDPVSNEFTQTSRKNTNLGLDGNLVLFNGLSRYYTLTKTKLSIENEALNHKIASRNVKLEVLTYYLQSLLSKDMIQLSKDHLTYTLEQERRMELMIEAESKTKIDLIEISSQKARDELAIVRAENDLGLAMQQLMRTMQVSGYERIDLDTSNALLKDTAVFVRVEDLPEVQQKELELQQAIIDEKINRASYFPVLSANGGLGSLYSNSYYLVDEETQEVYYPNFREQINGNFFQTISFGLSIPIYNQHQTRTNAQIQTLAIKNAELQREQLIWDLIATIKQLETDIKNAKAEMDAAGALLEAAGADFEQTELRYSKGLINYTELLNKKDRLYNAQSNLVQSKYNYYFKCKMLMFYNE